MNGQDALHTERSVVVLGMFDGVHMGHRLLLRTARRLAERRHVPLVCETFADHPLRLLSPDRCPPLLMTQAMRTETLRALGASTVVAAPVTDELLRMPPEDFVGHLVRRWHPTDVVVGYNYTFGFRGMGSAHFLETLGSALGFRTTVIPEVRYEGEIVSSTHIRELLARGNVTRAAVLMRRFYTCPLTVTDKREPVLTPEAIGMATVGTGDYDAVLCGARQLVRAISDGQTVRLRGLEGDSTLVGDCVAFVRTAKGGCER